MYDTILVAFNHDQQPYLEVSDDAKGGASVLELV